jgi:hypothetical protein
VSRWGVLAGTALIVVAAAGCRADSAAPVADPTSPAADPSPSATPVVARATLRDPLGEGKIDAAPGDLRAALLDAITDAGGARVRVTGGPRGLAFEIGPVPVVGAPSVQRISWREAGVVREQLALPDGRVCVNRVEGRALAEQGDRTFFDVGRNVHLLGTIRASGRPYSCTRQPSDLGYGSFVTRDLLALEPVSRLGRMMSSAAGPDMTDVGLETDAEGVVTRHVRYPGHDLTASERRVDTSVDVWFDGDLRLVRAEYGDLDAPSLVRVATFAYGGVPPVALPDAADRGRLGIRLAAPARQVVTTDLSGDADLSSSTERFAPSFDVTRVQATYQAASRTVAFRIELADLLPLTHDGERFEQRITISADGTGGGPTLLFERTLRGDRIVNVITAQMLHFGSTRRPCAGATSTVDTTADTILLAVPARCAVRTQQPARFWVMSQGIPVSGPRSGRSAGSDQVHTARALLTR